MATVLPFKKPDHFRAVPERKVVVKAICHLSSNPKADKVCGWCGYRSIVWDHWLDLHVCHKVSRKTNGLGEWEIGRIDLPIQ
jgi:hypothetical protein